MPGAKRTYAVRGKKRTRRTRYWYIGVREPDFFNFHRLAMRLQLSKADAFALIVAENCEARNLTPLTTADLQRMEDLGRKRPKSDDPRPES